MCGIAGFFLRQRTAQQATLQGMCDVIRHRGPDDAGYHLDGGCAIGMRRLSIIDLATGHQPISNEDGSVWVVFNGEIYNHAELRAALIAQGHRFVTNSDTETLVHLYEEEGTAGLAKLRGMFAFALWDGRRRKLLLVRDRLGKKPIYYALLPEGLYFGSELKCLRAAGVPLEVDGDALRLYFQFTWIPDPWTAFEGVRRLEAGTWLEYDADGTLDTGRYWRMPAPTAKTPADFSEQATCERLREIFDESVKMRMIADVPLGAFLSGGIDSSSVVASMARQSADPVKTFSIGFEEAEYNELSYAAMAARQYKTEHHEILVRPDCIGLVQKLVRQFDEPFADSSAIPTYIVSEFAAKHVKVALSGDGGDELFGGYESFQIVRKLQRYDAVPQMVRGFFSALAERLPYSAYGKNYLHMVSRPGAIGRYFESNYAPWHLRKQLLEPEWMLPGDEAYYLRAFGDYLLPGKADALSQALYFEATAKLTGDMLVKVDRMSMANSLEVRSPLLDHCLAEFAATIPHEWKIRNSVGKYILIRALGDRLPPELLTRSKMGFAVPLSPWLRGPLREMLWDHLTSDKFRARRIASPEFVKHLLEEHQSQRRDNRTWLWALLVLEMWFREIEDGHVEQECAVNSLAGNE